jgi:alpha-ribazole phosphatase
MHLLLIRHGETDWNNERRLQGHTDTPLNQHGIEQAEKLAERLDSEGKIEALYSSPLARASLTAEIVAQRVGLSPVFDDRLMEKHLGKLEGMSFDEIQQQHPDIAQRWLESKEHFLLPGEESAQELQARVHSFLNEITHRHNNSRVAIVSHGGTINMLISTLMELDVNRRWPFWFDNGSLSWMDLTGPRPRLRLLNDTCHLRNGHD